MLRDITERKEAQDLLLRQEKLAALGKLSSMVGHEIRTPLGTIRNAIEFIGLRLEKTLDEKVLRHLRILDEETGNIDRVIDDILGFARTRELEVDEIDPREIIEGTLEEVSVPGRIRIVQEFASGLAPVAVDRLQTRRAFRNLLMNAVEAMPKGGVLTIRVDRVDQADGSASGTRFTIRDTGEGIPRGLQEKIFEPLFTTKSKGTGLGLATVKNVVLAHRGKIEFESRKGEGTMFTLVFPGFDGF
jgi:signal transduction histidine kinase